MFRQVANTMFTCIEQYEPTWKVIHGVSKIETFGEIKYDNIPEPIAVSLPETVEAFKNNYDRYLPIYKSFLKQEIQDRFELLKQIGNSNIDFPSEVWVKTVYSFIAEFHNGSAFGRDKLIDALRVLWIGRVGAFLKETWDQSRDECENKILKEAQVFAEMKPYLIEKYYSKN